MISLICPEYHNIEITGIQNNIDTIQTAIYSKLLCMASKISVNGIIVVSFKKLKV